VEMVKTIAVGLGATVLCPALCVALLVGPAGAAPKKGGQVSMVGTYEMFEQWRYNGPGYEDYGNLTVQKGQTFVDSLGESGTWSRKGTEIVMRFPAPGCSIFRGERNGAGFDSVATPGHMRCPGGNPENGLYGTWYVTKIS